jgi:hypothetical protein
MKWMQFQNESVQCYIPLFVLMDLFHEIEAALHCIYINKRRPRPRRRFSCFSSLSILCTSLSSTYIDEFQIEGGIL